MSAAEFALLRQQVADLQAQASLSAVVIGGQVFKSLAQVTSWLALNSPTTGSHVAFVDASGLLAISHRDHLSPMEHAKLRSLTGKAGVGQTVAEVQLDFSFQLELPQFFGQDVGSHALSTSI